MLDQLYARLFHRPAAGVTRRRSLRALGGAALAASIIARPGRATARKNKKAKTCQDRERQRCAVDADACHDTTLRTCTATGFFTGVLGGA